MTSARFAVFSALELQHNHSNSVIYIMSNDLMYRSKIVFVGDESVGKTTIINTYCKIFVDITPTISVSSNPIDIVVDGVKIGLNLWDTAGQEKYKCLVPVYAKGAKIAVIVFDLTNKNSFLHVDSWYHYLVDEIGVQNIIVCANKSDLQSTIPSDEVQRYCYEKNIDIIETSGASGFGLDELFNKIGKKVLEIQHHDDNKCKSVTDKAESSGQSSSCC
jgi:small GTP-binding protein